MIRILFSLLLAAVPALAFSQLILVRGLVIDANSGQPLPSVLVSSELDEVRTLSDGTFEMELAMDVKQVNITFYLEGYDGLTLPLAIQDFTVKELGTIRLNPRQGTVLLAKEDQIPTVVISEDDGDSGGGGQDISGLLTASRDVFVSASAFVFGPARFRIRGLDTENTSVFLNGLPVNDLEDGRVYWSAWGGLNDVLRFRQTDIGLSNIEYTFGGLAGATSIDTRASLQREQLRASYAISNRTYRNRVMLTWSTGKRPDGWAVTLSGSRRWAEEGYIEGTPYDAWAYFASIDKTFGKHSLNLTALGAPIVRGRSSASIQEMYDLAGSNYYNSFWGYQNGEKRNSRIANTHQPLFMLRHDWNLLEKATLTTAVGYKFGRNGTTAIDWYDARDPRPDYYRYLPSFIEDPAQRAAVEEAFRNNEEARQLDWDYMYNANYNSFGSIQNANGIEGNTVSGRRSKYILEERRFDSKELTFNTIYNHILSDRFSVQGGLGYAYTVTDNFKVINDLLGGDFYVDIDRFAEFQFPGNTTAIQNDLNNPNRILEVGDRFGYDYNSTVHKGNGWAQGVYSGRRFDAFLAGDVSRTVFWRTGDVVNGRFPDNSFGDSEKQTFNNFGLKGGLTLKLDNKNYFYLNGAYLTRAPYFRDSYLSPRTRDQVVEGLTSEKMQSAELGYLLRSPILKARATVYYAEVQDQTRVLSFFNDEEILTADSADMIALGFVNFVLQDIDQRHLGAELALEWKVNSALTLSGVAALGQFIYTNRPTASIINDNDPNITVKDRVVYQKNYRVPGTPQSAYTAGINYRGKGFWFANLNFNYFDNFWLDFNPNRRTEAAIFDLDPNSEQWDNILAQEKVDPAFTIDFFGGKSFKIDDLFIYLNLGVSNILNKQDFITGGFEQLRFDFENQDPNTFPSRYFYSFGRTYFINLSLRI